MSHAGETTAQQPTLEAQLVFTEPLLRRVAWRYRWRRWGIRYLIALGVAAAALVQVTAIDYNPYLIGALGALALLAVMIAIGASIALRRQLLRNFRKHGGAPTPFRADSSGFTILSPVTTQTFAWSLVTAVWRFPDFWLLMFGRNNFITLPLASLSAELQTFVVDRVVAAGGKVR
jgi:hypothetical protein